MTTSVVLSLGANIGQPLARLRTAVDRLSEGLEDLRASAVFRTPPEGMVEQPEFLNMVVVGGWTEGARDLLRWIREIEDEAGRVRTVPNAPRTLDIDIVFFGRHTLDEVDLRVPHPRWSSRGFVIVPLLEVAPEWRDPRSGATVREIARRGGWTSDHFPRVALARGV
ncbi:MAG: 2-amino-4-hydroxy-6-hydroxymethyldihydropteridine diphosphokinase [Gemmatimonadota bacterium]|nr:2-amino-4-hydroxy-6-hydroxymethyldihydropteridine diphosphokinase [Gemmatimonadota bacterium]